ncbi:MAG: IPT/TIG domain-containing protein, partial [Terracidiphilus sp.]
VMTLNTIPLSIGNLQPNSVTPQGGQTMTIRGSGFQTGTTVSIGGTQISATFVDGNTLTVITPSTSPGWADVAVTLPAGTSYTAPGLLQVIGSQLTPVVTGFSPASVAVLSGIAKFYTPPIIAVLGSGFEVYDTVEINGQTVSSAFVDAAHLQATIPLDFTAQTGSFSVTVVSPYTGSSNSLALPLVNPVPVLEDNQTYTVVPGNGLSLNLYGTGFVSGSVIQWNGQNLPSIGAGGETASGLELIGASVAAILTTQPGTATVTVFNPSPGGGVSNSISVDISSAHPVLSISLNANNSIDPYSSFPARIDFGNLPINTSATYSLDLENVGTANYAQTSATTAAGPFTVVNNGGDPCASLPPSPSSSSSCALGLTFAPAVTGAFSATLTIIDNTPGSPHTITLTGAGVATPVPVVTLLAIEAFGQTISASLAGKTVVGGPSIPATAWVEYGTDPALSTFTQSSSWTLAGDGSLSASLSGLSPGTQYAARFAVKTTGGTGKSAIHLFATEAASPFVILALPAGSTGSATVTGGQTATYSLTASDGGFGYQGTAALSCTGAPLGAICTVTPSQVALSTASTSFTVTVSTTGSTTAQTKQPFRGINWALGLLLGIGVIAQRRRSVKGLTLLCFSAITLSIASCGGASSGGTGQGGGGGTTSTPTGTYTLTINASAGTWQDSALLTLTVN